MSTKEENQLSREERFRLASEQMKKKAEEAKRKKENKVNFTYENPNYIEVSETPHIIRLLGGPKTHRAFPSDDKEVYISMILGDNDKNFRCVWPSRAENPNWILWKIYNLVMSYKKWDNSLNGGKGGKVYKYVDSHPTLFSRVAKNNSLRKEEGGWYPKTYTVMNIIDRHDMAWHRENKHSKLLTKRIKIGDNGVNFSEPGIPNSLYTNIWNEVREHSGDYINYDIYVKKTLGSDAADTKYYAYHAEKDGYKLPDNLKKFVVTGMLTEEEKSWELYDLDKIFPITSYTKIKKCLGLFIENVDMVFGTSFSRELDSLVAAEQKKWEENKQQEDLGNNNDENEPEENEVNEFEKSTSATNFNVNVATQENTGSRRKTSTVSSFNLKDFESSYIGVSKLSDLEKASITGVDDFGQFTYNKSMGELALCIDEPACTFKAPQNFTKCPKCGKEFN